MPVDSTNDQLKRLLKEASRLTRAELLGDAESVLRQAKQLAPDRTDIGLDLAFVLVKQRRIIEAYDISYPIAQNEPKNSRAFAILGATYLTGGRFEDARVLLINSLRVNKKEHLAWAALGMLEFYENNLSESLQNLREAVFHKPDEPDYLFSLAQVSSRAELYREAADSYEKFLRVSKGTDKDRRARISGLIEFLRFLGHNGNLYRSVGRDQTKVQFELIGNRPIIDVRLNRHDKPLKFVLDTGSGVSVISDETARKLKIRPVARGGNARGIGGEGKFEIVYGFLREMSVGDVSVRNVPVYIRQFHAPANKVDGYIGLALVSKFLTTIDYGNQTLSLTKRSADRLDFENNEALSLPLRLTTSGFLSGEVIVEGVEAPLHFIVDTGASVSVISDQVAKIDAVSQFVREDRLRVIGSAGVANNVATFLLPRVSFGINSCRDIVAVALNLDVINETSGFEQAGILGGNFLKNYRLTFDFKNARVNFVSLQPEN